MTGGIGRLLIVTGLVIALVGLALLFADRLPWLGRLPGDLRVERGNWRVYLPLGTSLLLSVIITVLLNIFFRR